MIKKWRTLFRNGDYHLIVEDATSRGFDKLTIADFNYLGLSALASHSHCWFDECNQTSIPDIFKPYLSLYNGAYLYQQNEYDQASQLILAAKDTIIQHGHVFGSDSCSWLRGVNSYVHQLDYTTPPKPVRLEPYINTNDIPTSKFSLCFLASADSSYLSRFGKKFINSFIEYNDDGAILLLDIINPSEAAKSWVTRNAPSLKKAGVHFFYTLGPESRVYSASSRFLLAPRLLDLLNTSIFVLDIDSMFTKRISLISASIANYDCAFAQQTYRLPWQQCQAGRVYISQSPAGRKMARILADFCELIFNDSIDQWFLDQNALEYYRRTHDPAPNVNIGNFYQNSTVIDAIFCPPGSQKKQLEGFLY